VAEELSDERFERKLDPRLVQMLDNAMTGTAAPAEVPVIVQTVDGLKPEDREWVGKIGGTVRDDLYIINSFSATLPLNALRAVSRLPRVLQISYDAQVKLAEG
jgi:hypothetical protein